MSRRSRDRLLDIIAACEAIARHITRAEVPDDIVFDAIRVRLIEIGEAVKDLDPSLTLHEPGIPWSDIARMRDHLTHRYFDTTHAIVTATARHDIPQLAAAAHRLLDADDRAHPAL
ncbi:HepT-like ribonuclease domain-containing protein [Microbacterium sp. A93]|uniref:HepT-like ribonuclease domain-containing protein n=1 Tax=unclassified Microbacterium TaxID=2609290 RepID=UPI003F435673